MVNNVYEILWNVCEILLEVCWKSVKLDFADTLFCRHPDMMLHLTCAHSTDYTVWVRKKSHPWGLVAIFPKQLGIFQPNFTCLLCIAIYARLRIFIQLSATLTKLCHIIKRDCPVHIMCARCPPSAETHADIFWYFPKQLRIFSPNFKHLLNVHTYARMQIFIHLSPTVTKIVKDSL